MTEVGARRDFGAARRDGMSLVELLAALAIAGVLAGMALVAARGPRARADLVRVTAEARNLRLAEEEYRNEVGHLYNGPFTAEAAHAAGFNYAPPPDIMITVESADEATWEALLVTTSSNQGPQARRSSCRLSLNGATVCTLEATHQEEIPSPNTSAGKPSRPERPPTNGS